MSDEVEHLDSELSESLAKIRSDIEVRAARAGAGGRGVGTERGSRGAGGMRAVQGAGVAAAGVDAQPALFDAPVRPTRAQKLDWDTKQAGAPASEKREEILRIKTEIDKARAVLQNFKVELRELDRDDLAIYQVAPPPLPPRPAPDAFSPRGCARARAQYACIRARVSALLCWFQVLCVLMSQPRRGRAGSSLSPAAA